MNRFLIALMGCLVLLSATPATANAQSAAQQEKLVRANKWLDELAPSLDPTTRAQLPALHAILRRYYLDDASLTESEADIAEAITRGMPGDNPSGLVTRDPSAQIKQLQAALHKAPGVAARPQFLSGTRSTPGGKVIGYVDVTMQGRRRTVVEIMGSPPSLKVGKRAAIVASDMQAVQRAAPLWWTQMSVGRVRGEYVVRAPHAPRGYIITADSQFAREWGLSRPTLARQLITTIRRTFDPNSGARIAMRSATPTPGELRDAAVELRQEGDSLFKSSPQQALAKYQEAIKQDPSYAVPYVRICDIHLASHRKADARSILREALQAPGLDADERSEVQQKLNAIR